MDGILVLDKPEGFTSFDAVAVARGLTKEKKIGHTGTLDPMATGVLPLLLGRAAKAASLLPDTDKEYVAGFRLGERFDTGDTTGRLLERDGTPVSREALERAMKGFLGEISQTPPMYSAVSVGGKRLYQLARQGIEIERPARRITITRLELEEYSEGERAGILRVACSKGTYIRVLIEDLAQAAGSVGVMSSLRRVRACGFGEEEALGLEELRGLAEQGGLAAVLRPVESLFLADPPVAVSQAQGQRFRNGGALDLARVRGLEPQEGLRVRVRGAQGEFLGLGVVADRELRVLKLF